MEDNGNAPTLLPVSSPIASASASAIPPLHRSSPQYVDSSLSGSLVTELSPRHGASPILTPANKITDEGFRSRFDHIVVDKSAFEQDALGGEQLPTEAESTTHNVEFGGNEKGLQDSLQAWLDGLAGGNTVTTSELMNVVKSSGSKRKTDFANTGSTASLSASDSSPRVEKRTGQVSLKSLFSNYATFLKEKFSTEKITREWKAYPNDPRGCLVTVKSMQDTACLNKSTGILFQGEYKNKEKHEYTDGIRQCAGHLFHQLWWFRTVQGLFVEKAYGFVVCGPKCKGIDDEHASVSLLVLCAPDAQIGSKLKLYEYKQVTGIGDGALFRTLEGFVLKDWRQGNTFVDAEMQVPQAGLRPGSVLIPTKLLKQHEKQDTWKIIPSGTAALVIRLYLNDKAKAKGFVTKLGIDNQTKDDLENFIKAAIDEEKATLYLKMKTYLLGERWDRGDLELALSRGQRWKTQEKREAIKTWMEIYETGYLKSQGNVFVLMNDMGCRLSEVGPEFSFAIFCKEYFSMMDETLKVLKLTQLCHGDIHEGNVVYRKESDKGKRMRLIDWDEASINGPLKRELKYKTYRERYPNDLVDSPINYTKTQLLLLFRDVSRSLFKEHIYMDNQGAMQTKKAQDQDKILEVRKGNVENQFNRLVDFLKTKN